MTDRSKYIVAVDYEGRNCLGSVNPIAAGVAVLKDGKLVRKQKFNAFRPAMEFEEDTWTFWSEFPVILKSLEVDKDDKRTDDELGRDMIVGVVRIFHEFETIAKEEKADFEIITDTTIYDGSLTNALIARYQDVLIKEFNVADGKIFKPLPYSILTREFGSVGDLWCGAEWFLKGAGVKREKEEKLWDAFKRVWETPELPEGAKHDHDPANDAFCIAFMYFVICEIAAGRILKRTAVKEAASVVETIVPQTNKRKRFCLPWDEPAET